MITDKTHEKDLVVHSDISYLIPRQYFAANFNESSRIRVMWDFRMQHQANPSKIIEYRSCRVRLPGRRSQDSASPHILKLLYKKA